MARKIVRDVSLASWSSSSSVLSSCEDFSDLVQGYYVRHLKLPITADRKGCYERHGFRAPTKFDDLFSTVPFLKKFESASLGNISHGIAFCGSSNHWHFLIDGFGTLNAAVMRPDYGLHVDSELSNDQVQFLHDHAKELVAGDLKPIEKISEDLLQVSNFRFFANKSMQSKVSNARKTFGLQSRSPNSGDSKLFVLRNQARTRRLLNQESLAEKLEKNFGFITVDPSAMSLNQQKQLFSKAHIIVGPHGAGFANAIFSECLQLVLEIYHSKKQTFIELMCDGLGARHLYVEGTRDAGAVKTSSRTDDADYFVDEQSVLQAVNNFLRSE